MYSSPPVLHDLISCCTVSAGNTWVFCCFIAYWKVTLLVNGMKKLRLAIKEKLLMTFPKSLFKLLGHFLQKNKILNHRNPIVAPGMAVPSESKRMLRGHGVAGVQLTCMGCPWYLSSTVSLLPAQINLQFLRGGTMYRFLKPHWVLHLRALDLGFTGAGGSAVGYRPRARGVSDHWGFSGSSGFVRHSTSGNWKAASFL